MKTNYLLILLNVLIFRLEAQNFEWAKREGQAAYDYGYGIATDNTGNIYVAGKYELNANFSGTVLPIQGNHDIYVAKYSSTGALIWVRTAGGVDGDYAHALACDGSYVYVAGEIEGYGTTINFIGSGITLTSKGINDIFLAKYDLNGNLLWAKQAGGFKNDEALGITYDNAGNVYVCGFFNKNATFETTTINGYGGNDIFVAKYDKNGVFQWVRKAGGSGRDEAKSIKCDAAGNVYVCGMYEDTSFFGSQFLVSPNGYVNSFIAKYKPDGTLAWVRAGGGDYDDVGWALTIDNTNKIYVTGEFNAYAHFGNIALTTSGNADIFVASYDTLGNCLWAKKAGGPLIDRARGIGCDGNNLYITGQFGLSANFGANTISGADSSEIVIAKINNAGDFQWAMAVSGPVDSAETLGYEAGDAICAEASGNVYVTGALLNGGAFGNYSFLPYSRTDVFICKINQGNTPVASCNASGTITREFWSNVAGTSINTIPVNTSPANTSQLTIFEGPSQAGDNYASRIRGYICPPLTGNYIFWIASDNNSELWLSTDDKAANKVKIAYVKGYTPSRGWTKYPSQQSAPISLLAGVNYYIEALHKEGTQGDNLAVGWQLPNGALERPIPGTRLSPFTNAGNNPPVVNITSPVNNTSYPNPANITITADAISIGGSITKIEFYQGNVKIGEDLTAPYSYTWMNVNTGNYTLKAVVTDNIGQTGTSAIVNVVVTACSTPVITPLGSTILCSGSVVLQSSASPGAICQWKKDGVNISGATSASYTATAAGSYQIKVIQGSCISWSAPITVTIQNGLRATITPGGPTTFCSGENVKLFANTCSGYTYQWKKDGAYIPGVTSSTYTATTAGNYQVQITQAGISAWSALVSVIINACKELDISQTEETNNQTVSPLSDSSTALQMNVYPNPTTGLFTIQLNLAINQEERVNMRILNLLGQEIYRKDYVIRDNYLKETVELDKSLPTGVYTIQMIVGNKVENTSIILSR